MAIDSRNKRGSCLAVGLAIARVFSNPDGGIDTAAERQQAAYVYSGIDASGTVTVPEYGTATSSVALKYTATSSVAQRYTATSSVAQRYTATSSVGLAAEVD